MAGGTSVRIPVTKEKDTQLRAISPSVHDLRRLSENVAQEVRVESFETVAVFSFVEQGATQDPGPTGPVRVPSLAEVAGRYPVADRTLEDQDRPVTQQTCHYALLLEKTGNPIDTVYYGYVGG